MHIDYGLIPRPLSTLVCLLPLFYLALMHYICADLLFFTVD